MKGKTLLKAWNDFRSFMPSVPDEEPFRVAFYCGAAWAAHRMQIEETRILGDALKRLGAEAMDATCYAAQDTAATKEG